MKAHQVYLILYNAGTLIGWGSILYQLLRSTDHHQLDPRSLVQWTLVVQSLALLDILHSLLKFTRTPLMTVISQISSRLFVAWLICSVFMADSLLLDPAGGSTAPGDGFWSSLFSRFTAHSAPSFTLYALLTDAEWGLRIHRLMLYCWSITEVTRSLYYILQLCQVEPVHNPLMQLVLWLRYSLFYVLYPLGAGSEWLLTLRAFWNGRDMGDRIGGINNNMGEDTWVVIQRLMWSSFFLTILSIYPIGFYGLYTYMIQQRRKYLGLGSGKSASSKKKD